MPLALELTRTVPLFPYGVFLQWDLRGATAPGTYLFEVSRSASPQGPWQTLALLENAYNFRDTWPTTAENDINQLSLSRGIYYRVKVTGPAGSTEVVSVVEPRLDARHRLLKRKMLREQSLVLRKLNGLEVAVLKKKHWGARCPKCYDAATQTVMRSGCTTCYGTSFEKGYYTPVITLARQSTPAVETHLTPQGESDRAMTMVTLLDAPLVEKDDVLVFLAENRRFVVKRQVPGKLVNVVVFQHLEAAELERSAIEYRIQVDPLRTPPLF